MKNYLGEFYNGYILPFQYTAFIIPLAVTSPASTLSSKMFTTCLLHWLLFYRWLLFLLSMHYGSEDDAVLACAHDRLHFGEPGSGRIGIGLYHAFINRWLQKYPREQFHISRLEDFNANPKAYLNDVFQFLGLDGASKRTSTASSQSSHLSSFISSKNKTLLSILFAIICLMV